MSDPKLVDIACEVRHETDRAVLIHDGTKEVWLPLSQCEVYRERTGSVVTMPEWLAKAKGLI